MRERFETSPRAVPLLMRHEYSATRAQTQGRDHALLPAEPYPLLRRNVATNKRLEATTRAATRQRLHLYGSN